MIGANSNIIKSLSVSHIKFHYRRFDDYTIDDVRSPSVVGDRLVPPTSYRLMKHCTAREHGRTQKGV
ncbi:MAG: hypothetical protein ACK5QF_16590 [Dolichospermum sp.]